MEEQFGHEEFGFFPRSFLLPEQRDDVEYYLKHNSKPMIMKPSNWFCGIGIKLITSVGK